MPNSLYVVSADPGKTYGYVVWEYCTKFGPNFWAPVLYEVLSQSDGVPDIEPYRDDVTLLCEGTNFGFAKPYIQRCTGRLEGALGVTALFVEVKPWRLAVFGKEEFQRLSSLKGKKKWKTAAVQKCEELGYELPDRKDSHHLAEAYLIGHGYIHGLIPEKKITGLTSNS